MKKNGFTIIELLATLVVLGIIVGITLVSVNGSNDNAKKNTEELFIKNLENVIDVYLETSLASLSGFNSYGCSISKRNYTSPVYKYTGTVTFNTVINSSYSPMDLNDFVNPANKDQTCNSNTRINIFRDDDQVYYYEFSLDELGCLKYHTGNKSILPNCA